MILTTQKAVQFGGYSEYVAEKTGRVYPSVTVREVGEYFDIKLDADQMNAAKFKRVEPGTLVMLKIAAQVGRFTNVKVVDIEEQAPEGKK